jgi:thymidine kinase
VAKLYFRYGAMNSGKSTALIQVAHNYEERGQRVLIVKPATDTKSPSVLSRIGVERPVDLVAGADERVRGPILERRPTACSSTRRSSSPRPGGRAVPDRRRRTTYR